MRPPKEAERDGDQSESSSHMSDYDDMGWSPTTDDKQSVANDSEDIDAPDLQDGYCNSEGATEIGDAGKQEHREDSKPRMTKFYDEDEYLVVTWITGM